MSIFKMLTKKQTNGVFKCAVKMKRRAKQIRHILSAFCNIEVINRFWRLQQWESFRKKSIAIESSSWTFFCKLLPSFVGLTTAAGANNGAEIPENLEEKQTYFYGLTFLLLLRNLTMLICYTRLFSQSPDMKESCIQCRPIVICMAGKNNSSFHYYMNIYLLLGWKATLKSSIVLTVTCEIINLGRQIGCII